MRSITRPLATIAAATALALTLAACGGEDDKKAGDETSPSQATSATSAATTDGATTGATSAPAADGELCTKIADIVTVVGGVQGQPNEKQWGEIQDVYGALGEVELPADTPADAAEGRDIAVRAITSLDYADAEKAFGKNDGKIPGVTEEENTKAESFFTWAGQACPGAVGGDSASSATVPESSATAE